MKVIVVVLFFLLFSLSPLPSLAMVTSPTPPPIVIDGIEKKKVRGKKKKTASVRRVVTVPSAPVMETVLSEDGKQVIVNIYFYHLFAQGMQQVGGNVVSLTGDATLVAAFESSKDYQIAKSIIAEFKTEQAFFVIPRGTSAKSIMSTIALNKDKWTEQEIDALQKLVTKLFAPMQVSVRPNVTGLKRLAIPTLASVQDPKKDPQP